MVPTRLRTRAALLLGAVGLVAAVVVAILSLSSGGSTARRVVTPARGAVGYAVRGIYGRDTSATGYDRSAQLGFNLIDTSPSRDRIDALAARGLKGLVWLGGYSNTRCRFVESDAWIRTKVDSIAGNPGVGAYFIDDEPNAALCPNAPAAIRARAALVHSIDPGPPTLMVTFHLAQLPAFAHATDIIGLDHYPCSIEHGCDSGIILDEAAAADRLGIRYWGVVQAYGDDYYKVPTPEELDQEFTVWRTTKMEGYLVFAWRWPPNRPGTWLLNNQPLQRQLAQENRALTPVK